MSRCWCIWFSCFFFQAEDGIRDWSVTGVQTCALPIFEEQLLTRPAWNDSVLKYRIDGTSKVMGAKVFARDIRARDMPHWPQQQSHALVLRVSMADRSYAGFDLSALGSDLAPDRVVTAADLAHDGLALPDFYGEDMP